MKPLTLFILALAFSVRALSQTIAPGYVVRNGDTLRGNLKIDRQKDLMHRVFFKSSGGSDFTEYTPSDISAFRYDDGALYGIISFMNTAGPNPEAETLFGQTLVAGAYSLYRVDEEAGTYYVVKKDTATYFLYDDKISGTDVVRGNYRSLLLFFSAGCEGMDQSRASYSDKSLTRFLQQVNHCQAPGMASSSYAAKSRSETHIFVYGGGLPAGNDHQLTLDMAVRLVNPRIDPKASLNIGLRYSNTGTSTQTSSYDYIYRVTTYYVAKQTHEVFSLPVTFQYNLLSGRIQPAVYVGFSAAYLSENPVNPATGQKFGIGVIGGACIEGYITPHFLIKADWRYELLAQYPSVGVGYKF